MSDARSVMFSGGIPTLTEIQDKLTEIQDKLREKSAKAKAHLSKARQYLSEKAAQNRKAMKQKAIRAKQRAKHNWSRLRKMMNVFPDLAKAGSSVVLDFSKHPEATGAQTALELLNAKREKKGLPAIKLQKIVSATVLGSIQETTYAMCMEGSVGDENPFHFALELVVGEPNRLHHVRPRNVLDPEAKAVQFVCEFKVSWGIRARACVRSMYAYVLLCSFVL